MNLEYHQRSAPPEFSSAHRRRCMSLLMIVLTASVLFLAYAAEVSAATNYRSIGTQTGNLYATGTASILSGQTAMTFSGGADLSNAVKEVGLGDVVVVGGETFYILTRDSDTQVTVQTAATGDRSGTFTIPPPPAGIMSGSMPHR